MVKLKVLHRTAPAKTASGFSTVQWTALLSDFGLGNELRHHPASSFRDCCFLLAVPFCTCIIAQPPMAVKGFFKKSFVLFLMFFSIMSPSSRAQCTKIEYFSHSASKGTVRPFFAHIPPSAGKSEEGTHPPFAELSHSSLYCHPSLFLLKLRSVASRCMA